MMFKITKFFNLLVLYNLKIMDFTFKTLSEIVDPGQSIDDLKIEKKINVYLKNLINQFQAGDKSYKSKKDIEIQNYDNFYKELTNYNKNLYIDWDCINLKDQDFLIKEIEDIRSTKEDRKYINVVYDDDDDDDCYFKYSEEKINDESNDLFNGLYKKNLSYKYNYSRRCVFGQLYSRIKKDNTGAGVADDKYKKSYEYLDLSGYLLYDYVHNYSKYSGPICNYLNKFLEEQILNILNINNSYIPEVIESMRTFTLYDIIYPNSHYIYSVKDKNFCLPIDRVICHYDDDPKNIGSKENLKYEKKLTIGNFMEDIFGMSKNKIHKDIQDIFISCLNKKLFKLFTDVKDGNMFYDKNLTLIFPDIIALYAFFIKFNDKIRQREKNENKDNTDILNIEVYKSVNLLRNHIIDKHEILYFDLPFLYINDELKDAAAQNRGNVNALNFINRGTHDINPIHHREEIITKELCSQCFNHLSGVYINNFIFDVSKNNLYKFIFDSMLRIGKYGSLLLLINNFQGKACVINQGVYNDEYIKGYGVEQIYKNDFGYFCVKSGTKNPKAQENSKFVFSESSDANQTVNNVLNFTNLNFYSGLFGLLVLQTIYLNTVMSDQTYDVIYQLYNMGIKLGFAQHYIWNYIMEKNKDKVLKYYNNDKLNNFKAEDNGNMQIDDIILFLFKSLFLDGTTYDSIFTSHLKENVLNYNNFYVYTPQKIFSLGEKKKYIFLNVLEYYNSRTYKKILNVDSKEIKINKKKYRNIEILQMIKKLTQGKLNLYVENNKNIENIPKEKKELTKQQKDGMLEIVGTVAKKIKPETDKINNIFKIYGELKEVDRKPDNNIDEDENIYKELLKDVNARHLFKGGVLEEKTVIYNQNNDIYSLLLLNYYDKLTIQKLKYYYLFNILLNSGYFSIIIDDDSSYLNDDNGLNVLFSGDYKNINLFITEELTEDAQALLKIISCLIYYYFYGINYQLLKNKKYVINRFYSTGQYPGVNLINCEAIRKTDGDAELDFNNVELFKIDTIKKTFDEINDQLPNDIKIKENNNLKQNINNQGQTIMQSNNNGIYSLSQIPEITKQNLTEGNNINVSFLNNNGLLPFLLSRNLNNEVLKGGDSLFNRAADAFGKIRHMSISDIINLYRKGGNGILNVEQMTFLKNAERLDKEREEEYNLIIGVINYIRDSIKRENIPEKELKSFDEKRNEMKKTGFKADKTIELYNMHVQKGGKDIPDILTKLKQGQYRRQQIDNNYIEELNNYLKGF